MSGNISILEKLNEEKMNALHKEIAVEDVAIKVGFLVSMEYWMSQLYYQSQSGYTYHNRQQG